MTKSRHSPPRFMNPHGGPLDSVEWLRKARVWRFQTMKRGRGDHMNYHWEHHWKSMKLQRGITSGTSCRVVCQFRAIISAINSSCSAHTNQRHVQNNLRFNAICGLSRLNRVLSAGGQDSRKNKQSSELQAIHIPSNASAPCPKQRWLGVSRPSNVQKDSMLWSKWSFLLRSYFLRATMNLLVSYYPQSHSCVLCRRKKRLSVTSYG